MDNNNEDDEDEKGNKKNSIENNARIKIKEYFKINKSLKKNNFNNFIDYIGLSEIWSLEEEKNLFWENLVQKSENKNEIDYKTVISGVNAYFEEEVDDDIKDNNLENNNNENENEFDDLMDIDLQSLHFKSINFNQKENEKEDYEKSIEIFINNIKDKKNILYSIRFINEIFFSEYLEKEINDFKIDNLENNSFLINKKEINNEIMSKYNFINLENNILNDYLKIISKENNNEKEIIIEKAYLIYANETIKNIINEEKRKNSILKPLNINAIKLYKISNNINISQNIEKLKEYDSNINKCISSIINLNKKKSYIYLVQEYISNYIINLKNSIYEELETKNKEYEEKYLNFNYINKGDLINMELEKENNRLKSQNEKLIKENLELLKKIENKEEEIMNKDKTSEFNINEDFDIIESKKNIPKIKSKIIIPPLKLKLKDEETKITDKYAKNNLDYNIKENNSINLKNNEEKCEDKIQENKSNTSNDVILQDITNSDVEVFSLNNNITDQFLLDTTRLCNEDEELNKSKESKNINLKSNDDDELNLNKRKKNNFDNYSNRKGSDILSYKNKHENYEEELLYEDLNLYPNNNTKNNFIPLTDRNYRKYNNRNNKIINIDSNHKKELEYYKINKYQNYFGMEINKPQSNKNIHTNEDIFYGYVNKQKTDFYDFKYLIKNNKIKKLFHTNGEKLHKDEFFSNDIMAIFNNDKKKKFILIISYNSFYFLKSNENLEFVLKLEVNSLKSITVSKKHFNLVQFLFEEGTNIIIEIHQRMEMLRFIQNMIDKGIILNELKITASNYFIINKKNGEEEKIHTIKNNLFSLTPNFENAQKVGILLKYKSGFFSSSFQEKLIVLCSIGLIIFDDDYKTPKNIIPIIGTTIKFIVVQLNKKIYCLKMKTIKDETFIVGSSQKKEIFDWLKEFAEYKKIYQLKMKEINPCFIGDYAIEMQDNNIIS